MSVDHYSFRDVYTGSPEPENYSCPLENHNAMLRLKEICVTKHENKQTSFETIKEVIINMVRGCCYPCFLDFTRFVNSFHYDEHNTNYESLVGLIMSTCIMTAFQEYSIYLIANVLVQPYEKTMTKKFKKICKNEGLLAKYMKKFSYEWKLAYRKLKKRLDLFYQNEYLFATPIEPADVLNIKIILTDHGNLSFKQVISVFLMVPMQKIAELFKEPKYARKALFICTAICFYNQLYAEQFINVVLTQSVSVAENYGILFSLLISVIVNQGFKDQVQKIMGDSMFDHLRTAIQHALKHPRIYIP